MQPSRKEEYEKRLSLLPLPQITPEASFICTEIVIKTFLPFIKFLLNTYYVSDAIYQEGKDYMRPHSNCFNKHLLSTYCMSDTSLRNEKNMNRCSL